MAGQQELVIGTPEANRGRLETESLVGFFVSTLALRIDLRDDPDLPTLIARIRHTVLAARENRDLPFEQVVELVNPPRHRVIPRCSSDAGPAGRLGARYLAARAAGRECRVGLSDRQV